MRRCAGELRDATIQREGPETVAAVIMEPVHLARAAASCRRSAGCSAVRDICDELDVLMIADEVITGFGRTGRWFAVEHDGVVPDIMSVAKGITSGYIPLSASIARASSRMRSRRTGEENVHPNTYAAHPVACAAGLANLQIMREGQPGGERRRRWARGCSKACVSAVGKSPIVGEVRGARADGGVELSEPDGAGRPLDSGPRGRARPHAPGSAARSSMREVSVLRLAPPLCITREEVDQLVGIVAGSIESLNAEV